jgi:hypothetical protein
MKCSECHVDIPPAWKHAYEQNYCPSCGGNIFNEPTQELMRELKDAMEQMPNDPQGLAGWLLSNYRMEKVGDGEPTGFYGPKPKNEPPADKSDLKIAQNRLQQFFKNAGIKNPTQNRMADLVKQISGEVEEEGDEESIMDNEEYIEEANDPEFTQAVLQGMVPAQNLTPAERARFMQQMASEAKDEFSEKIHPALDEDRKARLQKQKELNAGGVGLIKR